MSRRAAMRFIEQFGEVTAEQIAQGRKISGRTARDHIVRLEEDGHVERIALPRGTGGVAHLVRPASASGNADSPDRGPASGPSAATGQTASRRKQLGAKVAAQTDARVLEQLKAFSDGATPAELATRLPWSPRTVRKRLLRMLDAGKVTRVHLPDGKTLRYFAADPQP